MFCDACNICRKEMRKLLTAPWDYVLSHYEFMILFTAYHRNITFYSNMDLGQLKMLYSQLVSYSPAKILVIDKLVATYKAQHETRKLGIPNVPCTLSSAITLALGNGVPKRFIHMCISRCNWTGYDHMILASFAAAEGIRGGALKYMAILKAQGERGRRDLHVIVSAAITGWMMRLSSLECTCGTWDQVVDMVSCSVSDAETSLMLQSESRVTTYICTLLNLYPGVLQEERREERAKVDYEYVFNELLVSDLSED